MPNEMCLILIDKTYSELWKILQAISWGQQCHLQLMVPHLMTKSALQGVKRNRNIRWQHLCWMKDVLFWLMKLFLTCDKTQQAIICHPIWNCRRPTLWQSHRFEDLPRSSPFRSRRALRACRRSWRAGRRSRPGRWGCPSRCSAACTTTSWPRPADARTCTGSGSESRPEVRRKPAMEQSGLC